MAGYASITLVVILSHHLERRSVYYLLATLPVQALYPHLMSPVNSFFLLASGKHGFFSAIPQPATRDRAFVAL